MLLNLADIKANHFNIEISFVVSCERPQRLADNYNFVFLQKDI